MQAKPGMVKSTVVDNETGKSIDSTVRTSTGTFFGREVSAQASLGPAASFGCPINIRLRASLICAALHTSQMPARLLLMRKLLTLDFVEESPA